MRKFVVHDGGGKPKPPERDELLGELGAEIKRVQAAIEQTRTIAVSVAIHSLVLSRGVEATHAYVTELLATLRDNPKP